MKGFGGMPGNLQTLMKQAQKMQADLQKTQEEAAQMQVEGSAGGGAVKVVLSGKFVALSVDINPSACSSDDREILQDMIVAAFNDASSKVQAALQERMSKVTGGVPIPGLF